MWKVIATISSVDRDTKTIVLPIQYLQASREGQDSLQPSRTKARNSYERRHHLRSPFQPNQEGLETQFRWL